MKIRLRFATVCLLAAAASIAAAHDYTIHLPKDLSTDQVQMTYFESSAHGGGLLWGGAPPKTVPGHEFVIPASGSDNLEVVMYCPGYGFVTVYEPALRKSKYEASVRFQELPQFVIHGEIENYHPLAGKQPVVVIHYWGWAGLTHTNIVDGGPPTTLLAAVPLSADGHFTAKIPDLYHDPVWLSTNRLTILECLQFEVQDEKSGNGLLRLHPKGAANHYLVEIRKSYPNPFVMIAEKDR